MNFVNLALSMIYSNTGLSFIRSLLHKVPVYNLFMNRLGPYHNKVV